MYLSSVSWLKHISNVRILLTISRQAAGIVSSVIVVENIKLWRIVRLFY